MDGRVVDSKTRQPVAGAIVAIHDHPSTKTKSGEDGRFHFPDYHNFHLGLAPGICAYSWPEGQDWHDVYDIAHPLYGNTTIHPLWTRPKSKNEPNVRRDILLVRKHE